MKQHTLAVLYTILLDNVLGIAARIEGTPENFGKLLVQATDSELLKAHIFFEKLLRFIRADLNALLRLLADLRAEDRVFIDDAKVLGACMFQCLEIGHLHFKDHFAIFDCQRKEFASVEVLFAKEADDGLGNLALLEGQWLAWLSRKVIVHKDEVNCDFDCGKWIRHLYTCQLKSQSRVNF